MLCEPESNASDNLCHLCRTTATVLTVRVYLTVFLFVTSTGKVMGRVIVCVTQYLPYHTLCKSQYVLMTLSRAWSVPITFNHNDMSVSTVRILHRLCVLLCFTVSDPTRKCPMLDSYMGHAGAIQGVYVICIWGVQRMGLSKCHLCFW